MANTVNFSCRMDRNIKLQSEALYNELGMNLTTAINVFLRESLRSGGFPFDVRISKPNQKTVEAFMEAEALVSDPKTKRYSNVEDALAELKR